MNDAMDPRDEQLRLIEERNALRDRATVEAHRLRNEAFTGAVVGAGVFVRQASLRAARAANRLAARLRHHARLRAAATET